MPRGGQDVATAATLSPEAARANDIPGGTIPAGLAPAARFPYRAARMRTRRPAQEQRRPAAPIAALPIRHPAHLVAALIAAACVVVSVSAWIYDTDFWHHLLVGKVIWETHGIPTRHLWTWPSYGNVDANNAWLFRAMVWPLWSEAGIWGLFAWRWITTLAVFGIVWVAARRMGAKGLTPLVVIATCALVYRQRTQLRPETLVSVLMALQILLLEMRRCARDAAPAARPDGGAAARPAVASLIRDPALWLIPIAWVWANTHPSYYMGFIMIGFHLLDDLRVAARARGATADAARAGFRRLVLIALAGFAISFANPWGWRPLWQPFEFFLTLRNEPIYQGIGELQHLEWGNNARNGLAVMLVLWPLLAVWRWRRTGFDLVEALCLAFFTALMLNTQRFTGSWAVVAAPYLSRDLDAWIGARRWPAWTRPAWTRAALAALACVAIGIPEWRRVEYPLGVRLDMARYPVRACDFMAEHGVRGRGFNDFQGGYQAWRFWPDRERLPFMTGTPEAATKEDRNLLALSQQSRKSWLELDARHRFDYLLISRFHSGWGRLLDFLDVDSTWALVFADDAAALYVRRGGPLDSVATRHAYRFLPGGTERIAAVGQAAATDSAVHRAVEAELHRQTRESPYNSQAFSLLARMAYTEQRWSDARRYTASAIAAEPLTPGEHERLGLIALAEGRPAEALEEFRRERRLVTSDAGLDLRFGQAYAAMGDVERARRHLVRELARDPANAEARAVLGGLGGGRGQ